jgi:hypothetical protein
VGKGSRQIGFETLGKELALWVERVGLQQEVCRPTWDGLPVPRKGRRRTARPAGHGWR